jgi:DNA uptake protein ComE-like DNA-binding protein
MKSRTLSIALTAAVLLLSAGMAFANENKTDALQSATTTTATKADSGTKKTKSEIDAKHKQVAKIKLVDINSAKKEELKKLPGIGDAEADKIIAGRPFGSKLWLVSKNIIPMITYQVVKDKIICKLTKKDTDIVLARAAHDKKK